jgi:hypothetical protein
VFIFIINLLGIRVFGELEFWFSSKFSSRAEEYKLLTFDSGLKVLTLIGLLFMSIVSADSSWRLGSHIISDY